MHIILTILNHFKYQNVIEVNFNCFNNKVFIFIDTIVKFMIEQTKKLFELFIKVNLMNANELNPLAGK